MSLTSLLRDPQSSVRVYLDGISPLLGDLSGPVEGWSAAVEALGLSKLVRRRTLVPSFPGTDLPLIGTAFDFRARIELQEFNPDHSLAAAGVALLPNYVPLIENGPHRARILTEAFHLATTLVREPFSDSDLDRAAILLAHCEQIARAGVQAMKGSVGDACDAAIDGQSFADNLNALALADIRSLLLTNADQLETWQEQIEDGDPYDPNPAFVGSGLVGGADADWVIGETLIDCKVYSALTVPKLRDFIRQLLGYVMLDSDDRLGIRHVGIWLPRQSMTPTWSLTRLLGGDPEELLPSLRQGLIKATEKTQLAPHSPISAKRRHQLLADNRHTPYETLAALASSKDIDIRRRVGRNAVTPEETLRILAEDLYSSVREGVARNEAAPRDVLGELAHDRSIAVRRAAAMNPKAPAPAMRSLATDAKRDPQSAAKKSDGVETPLATGAPSAGKDAIGESHDVVRIGHDRDESALDSKWFADFLQTTTGVRERMPIPDASYRWGSQTGRPLVLGEWMRRRNLPDQVLKDLMRADRPVWVRRMIAGTMPLFDPTVREELLNDADPEIRWITLKRSADILDEPVSTLLVDLAASGEARLKFRTEGMGARREWTHSVSEYQHETLCLIASHPATPYSALLTLMSSTSAQVLTSLIQNPALEADDRATLFRSMQTSKSVAARELLASLELVPETVLIDLAADRDVRVRTAAAQNPFAPTVALSSLAVDPKRAVRLAVLENVVTPGDLASSIAAAMLLVDIDEDLHAVLTFTGERADIDVPLAMIEEALDRLSKSRVRCPDMRVVVADDRRSSGKTLSRLARSTDDLVRGAVAGNPAAPVAVILRLVGDPEANVRAGLADNPASPPNVLKTLSHDGDSRVRARTAGNPKIPQAILENLISDTEADVRAAALKNPATPVELVRKAEASWERVTRPSPPDRAALEEMVANKRAEVRMEVAFNPGADPDLLALLGGERRSSQVRRAVAANPNTPAEVLASLAEDQDDQVRQAVAFNGATPGTLLADLAGRSLDLAILVALNPDVPEAVLDTLQHDSNSLIRFVAVNSRKSRTIFNRANVQALEGPSGRVLPRPACPER
ncbi:hypothetical protein [Arthrobacter sp. zg-Y769]|uniref:hypothetical protein n=1 Tax=Arthrobacter sp. zg-Y769 TaxID=2894191 RepID=UPI001E44A0DC|nr:hypothetical protein [Arthrobacter sp. zg-Y769]MCC9205870.1 hypothetical protein [Arthrobacter sp. zg-Y769]